MCVEFGVVVYDVYFCVYDGGVGIFVFGGDVEVEDCI